MQLAPVKLHFVANCWRVGWRLLTVRSMPLTPAISVHITVAIAAVLLGPFAIWARKSNIVRPKLHRAVGYAWVTCMLLATGSAMWIRDYRLPNIAGYTPIHLLVPFTLGSLGVAFYALARGNIRLHQSMMVRTYVGACLVAGGFTFMPGRLMHQWLMTVV
jgi:uncharacterized membrane protein